MRRFQPVSVANLHDTTLGTTLSERDRAEGLPAEGKGGQTMAAQRVQEMVSSKQAVSTNLAAFAVVPRGKEIILECGDVVDEPGARCRPRFASGRARPEAERPWSPHRHLGRRLLPAGPQYPLLAISIRPPGADRGRPGGPVLRRRHQGSGARGRQARVLRTRCLCDGRTDPAPARGDARLRAVERHQAQDPRNVGREPTTPTGKPSTSTRCAARY